MPEDKKRLRSKMRGMNGENVPKKDTKKRETERSGENQKVLEEEETKKKKRQGKNG